MGRCRQRILPNQIFFRHFRPEVTGFWPHITVGQLEPRPGERLVKGLRIVEEAAGDFFKLRVEAQGQVGDQHGRFALFLRVKRIRDNLRRVFGFELDRASRAAGLHPFVFEQVFEKVVAPLGGRLRPDHFQTGGDGVRACAAAVAGVPAQTLRFQRRGFRLGADVAGFCGAVGFAQRMAAGDQRDDLFIVHRHIAEGGANGRRGGQRLAAGVRTFRVDINQTHFGGADGLFRQAFRMTVGQPLFLIAPVDVEIRFPDVFATGAKAKGAEAGVFQSDVTRQHVKVGPGDFLAIFLFHRPQQTAGLIEADVVRPGVQGGKALLSTTCAAATVNGAVGAGAVPGHTNKQANIATPVCRPPLLRIGQQRSEISLQRGVIELFKLFPVVKILTQRVGAIGVLV
ncbi:Uncharacterised protein [Klebsiella pneumoniae]|nr:Uncharacterised protein [Klebsiella pneumoniae]SLO80565.1 Uncharacterised protein [Klebsiella pneumoniae]